MLAVAVGDVVQDPPQGDGGAGRLRSSRPLGFPPERRLRQATQFKQLYAQGRRLSQERFTAVVRANDAGGARLGLSVAARLLRLAVQRNRVRRVVRESFRHHQHQLPSVDIVIGLRGPIRDLDATQMRRALERLWQKIAAP